MKLLQRSLFVLAIAISIEIILGAILLEQYNATLKTIHGTIGATIGLGTLATLYLTFREKSRARIRTVIIILTIFIILAISGGRLAGVDYEVGLTLMRASAYAALVTSVIGIYLLKKPKK
jgi:hypothetical protein